MPEQEPNMKSVLKDESFRISIFLTSVFLCTGLVFLLLDMASYGFTIFFFLPIVLGISLGTLPDRKMSLRGALVTTGFILFLMLLLGLSGAICIVMVIPLIIPFIFLGYVLVYLAGRYREIKSTNRISFLMLPLRPFLIAAPTERYIQSDQKDIVEVRTERVYEYSPMQVYEVIKSVDTMVGEKPFLMKFDLPIPVKCVLEKEAVGGSRVCYFKGGRMSNRDFGGGTIHEKITALDKGKLLQMDVTDYNLIGRKWLGFKEAIYYFDSLAPNRCKLTRVTTYTSVLNPRIYWEPLEKLGISQEHDYVFSNIDIDLKKRFKAN